MSEENYPQWKVNDWCFCERTLHIVREVEKDGRVSGVSDGRFWKGSWDLRDRMFPLTVRGKLISEHFEYEYERLHKESNNARLNFPDLNRYYIAKWCEAMKCTDDDEALKQKMQYISDYTRSILENVAEARSKEMDGVAIYR